MREPKTLKHEAFGNIQISRISGGLNLYDSPIRHRHMIALRIQTAECDVECGRRWHTPKRIVTEVYMSASQFAEAITSMNTSGVPCTLTDYRDPETGERVRPNLRDPELDIHEDHTDNIREAFQNLVDLSSKIQDALGSLAAPGASVKKKDLNEVASMATRLRNKIEADMPYLHETFMEASERETQRAKAEVVALADYVVHTRGLESLGVDTSKLLGSDTEDND